MVYKQTTHWFLKLGEETWQGIITIFSFSPGSVLQIKVHSEDRTVANCAPRLGGVL